MSYRDDRLQLHFIILSRDAGGIIGKEGRNIRQMRDESSANINISGNSGVERVLNVTGSGNEIRKAVRMVALQLQENNKSGNDDYEAPVTLRLLVPNSQCGPLIGKGGQRIKDIRESSGASVMIPSETMMGSTERSVTLSGSPDALGECISRICDVLEEFPARQNVNFFPNVYPSMRMGSPQYGMMGGQYPYGGMSQRSTQKLNLPTNVIGSLIGKGGCHINEIRQFSGAQVKIEESENSSRRTIVTVSGTPEAVSAATFLINARISAGRQAIRNRRRPQEKHEDSD